MLPYVTWSTNHPLTSSPAMSQLVPSSHSRLLVGPQNHLAQACLRAFALAFHLLGMCLLQMSTWLALTHFSVFQFPT